MFAEILLAVVLFDGGVADIFTLIAVGRDASCTVDPDPRSGVAAFQPHIETDPPSQWCSKSKVIDLPREELVSAAYHDRITERLKQHRGRFSCAALSYRTLPSFVWIETEPTVLPSLGRLMGCRFPHDCLDALAAVDKAHWAVVANDSVEHDHHPLKGQFWLSNTRLLPVAVNSSKYYHCLVERKRMCAQSPLALDANRSLRRPSVIGANCQPRNRTICSRRLLMNKTDDFCPNLSSVQLVLDDEASYFCRERVADLICRFLFSQELFRETCYLDKLVSCEVTWKILDEKYHTYWFWPRCDDLPSSHPNVTISNQNKTFRNRACQPWQSQCPIEHNFLPEIYPDLVGARDHCVSFNGGPSVCIDSMATIDYRPTHWSSRAATCLPDSRIFPTRNSNNETEISAVSKKSPSSSWPIWLLVLAVIGLGLVLVLKTCSKKPRSAIELATPVMGVTRSRDDRRWLQRNDLYYETRTVNYGDFATEAPIDLLRPLSAGAHGTVYLGRLQGEFVAVKMMKRAEGDDGAYATFVHEGWALRQIGDHEHIVKLLAVRSDPVDCLVFEFMPCCDLKNMLRYCNKSPVEGLDSIRYDRSSLYESELVNIMLQTLDGAAFIAAQGWIHRDLAARNCLVGHGLVVKIGDFGLCRRANQAGCFLAESAGEVAVRWAAPEVLLERRYSFASDVWAWAVLVWELFTMGEMPFYGLSASEASDAVLKGQRLSKPARCPDQVWFLMLDCFANEEILRPTFAQLIRSLN